MVINQYKNKGNYVKRNSQRIDLIYLEKVYYN